jgi:ADP-ribosyl-[dinitrogen reductase] hydrolase
MEPTKDRSKGCLYGLAVGDALGAAVEFRQPGSFAPVFCYRGLGPHGLDPGEWTDDTSMALALAHSLGANGFDPADQMRRYLDWFQNGAYSVNDTCFDIGTTTRAALLEFERHGDPARSGDPDEGASGNGSIMRLAPVVIWADGRVWYQSWDSRSITELCRASSIPTHPSDQCQSACAVLGLILSNLLAGWKKERGVKRQRLLCHRKITSVHQNGRRRKLQEKAATRHPRIGMGRKELRSGLVGVLELIQLRGGGAEGRQPRGRF